MSCTELEVSSPIMVDAQIQRWTITSDDIYLIKFNEAPPQWLEDMVEGIMDDTGLVDDVSDLEDRFDNFEEGYTEHFYDWVDGDKETLLYVENIYTTNAVYNAGIQEIKTAYVSWNESGAMFDTLIGAWQTGAGGAWFNSQVSVVSNVAYSAAKSASTLTASLSSQQDQLEAIVGDIEILEKQVDGKVETFTGTHPVVNPDGTLIPDAEPYATWVIEGTVAEHTGDTYVQTEEDVNGNEAIIGLWGFTYDSNTQIYTWTVITDTLAAQAYQTALEAGALADGKINTYYQTYPPTIIEDPTMGDGDLWIDSDDDNKLYRYDEATERWLEIRDRAIQASVDRLDEATVDINGIATAKSTLVVDADGRTTGFVAEASNDPDYDGSLFQIYADKFYISGAVDSGFSQAPFSIDTTRNQIKFDGVVEFTNTLGSENVLFDGQAANDINQYTTTIDGGKITAYSLNANRIAASTIWVGGLVQSDNFLWNSSGLTGFRLDGRETSNWNIIGGSIYGGKMNATTLDAVTINTGTLNADVINSGDLTELIRGTNTLDVENKEGTGTLLTYNLTWSVNTGTYYLKRNGSVLAHMQSVNITDGGWITQCTFVDVPGDFTYTIENKNGVLTGAGTFAAVLYKK